MAANFSCRVGWGHSSTAIEEERKIEFMAICSANAWQGW